MKTIPIKMLVFMLIRRHVCCFMSFVLCIISGVSRCTKQSDQSSSLSSMSYI
jgi:hypothetical protein